MENKKGLTQVGLIFIVFAAIAIMIIMGIFSLVFGTVDTQLSKIHMNIGNSSFEESYQDNLQPSIQNLQNTFPKIVSLGLMIGMILCLIFVSTKTKTKSKLWIILDIGIILLAEFVAVLVSKTFINHIMNVDPQLLSVYINTLSVGAKFILYLPGIIPTIGAIVMIATYILRRERSEDLDEQPEEGGLYQMQ